MRRIGVETAEVVTLRIPREWVDKYRRMSDKENPWRAIMRDAIRLYLKKLGKLEE